MSNDESHAFISHHDGANNVKIYVLISSITSRTWDGGATPGDFSMSNSNNWNPNTAPSSNEALIFDGTTGLVPNNDLTAGTNYAGITFNSGSGAFTLGGNSFNLTGNITNNDDSNQTINTSGMVLSGSGRSVNAAAGNVIVSSIISGTQNLSKGGSYTLTLSGNNTYVGATTISGGALRAQHANALGTTAAGTTISGGTLELEGGITVGAEALTIGASGGGSLVATGGTITNVGGYRIHTFTSNSNFVVNKAQTVEYLIIGGGGGGFKNGGGGAGGYRCSVAGESSGGGASAEAPITVTPQTYPVVVGAGGLGNAALQNGGNSSFAGIVAIGGGGANTFGATPNTGGSGGGGSASGTPSTGASGTANQGYAGGDASASHGGGGGGAGGIGANAVEPVTGHGGNGGIGVTSSITGTAVARAGGGGGGGFTGGDAGATGGVAVAGGGNGATGANTVGSAATANTGGGGGGGVGGANGGNGASGIVIIRYRLPAVANVSGNNTLQGAITLGSDAQIDSDAGSLSVDVSSGNAISGTYDLTFGGAGNITVADPIATSTGKLTKTGSGTLMLSGNNTYSGATTISEGTLQIGNAGTSGALSGSSSITNNATLIFNRTDTLTQGTHFGSVISGTGAVTQAGSGTLTLSGTNTYSGTTTVSAGVLALTGSCSSSAFTVSGGTLAPGGVDSADTTNPTQAFTIQSGGTVHFDLSAPQTAPTAGGDQLQVTGNLTLAGTLTVNNLGSMASGTYTLFTYTGTQSGSFSTVTMPNGTSGVVNVDTANKRVNLVATVTPTPTPPPPATTNLAANPSATPLGAAAGTPLTLSSSPTGGSGTYTTYAWTGPNGFTSSAQNPGDVALNSAGTFEFSLTVTDSLGATKTQSVSAIRTESALSVTASATPSLLAEGESTALSATTLGGTGTNVTWLWSGPNSFTSDQQVPSSVTPATIGVHTYAVTVWDSSGQRADGTVQVMVASEIDADTLSMKKKGAFRYLASSKSSLRNRRDHYKLQIDNLELAQGDKLAFSLNGIALGHLVSGTGLTLDEDHKASGVLLVNSEDAYFTGKLRYLSEGQTLSLNLRGLFGVSPVILAASDTSSPVEVGIYIDRAPADGVIDEIVRMMVPFKVSYRESAGGETIERGKSLDQ